MADTTAPTIVAHSGSRAMGPMEASANIVVTFSENVVIGTGTILLMDPNTLAVLVEIPVESPLVTVSGNILTINPSEPLLAGISYSLRFPRGAILDLAGNSWNPEYGDVPIDVARSRTPLELHGTDGVDTLIGGASTDTIHGGDGTDEIYGFEGDDRIYGGNESNPHYHGAGDYLYGGEGNDFLYGEGNNDFLIGNEGNDVLDGGDGNDRLVNDIGSDILLGGAGDDTLESNTNGISSLLDGGDGNDTLNGTADDTLVGGAGDDTFRIGQAASGAPMGTVDGGDGNDRFIAAFYPTASSYLSIAGGSGRDTYAPARSVGVHPSITALDFVPGAGGDQVDLDALLGFTDGNPFAGANPLVKLAQEGSDTLLLARPILGGEYQAVMRLKNVAVAQLTGENFKGGIRPDGGPEGLTTLGTAAGDILTGDRMNDTLSGADGADILWGQAGDDVLTGGESAADGNDSMRGGGGNDTLSGGAGDDNLNGDDGDDVLHGGSGDDLLQGGYGDNTVDGGSGNDLILVIDGGTAIGGEGNDQLEYASRLGTSGIVTFDGGAGSDKMILRAFNETSLMVSLRGGGGADQFVFDRYVPRGGGVITIQDFSVTEGDQIAFTNLIPSALSGNPFGAIGYLRAEQVGNDVLISVDKDGAAGTTAVMQPLFTLAGITLSSLGKSAFAARYDPTGAESGPVRSGTDNADILIGTELAEELSGLGGRDNIQGGGGDDKLFGDDGNDQLAGDAGNDSIDGGAGLDYAIVNEARAHYSIHSQGNSFNVLHSGTSAETDTLSSVERILFTDAAVALDTGADGVAGEVYRLYQAAFGRTPDAAGVGFWISAADRGMALEQIAGHFMQSAEFISLYRAETSNAELVRLLYVNALHRQPDDAGVAFWTDVLDTGRATRTEVIAGFSESVENQEAVANVIGNGFPYIAWP